MSERVVRLPMAPENVLHTDKGLSYPVLNNPFV